MPTLRHAHTHANRHMLYTRVCRHSLMHAYTHSTLMHIQILTLRHTHTHIHTHVCTRTQAHTPPPLLTRWNLCLCWLNLTALSPSLPAPCAALFTQLLGQLAWGSWGQCQGLPAWIHQCHPVPTPSPCPLPLLYTTEGQSKRIGSSGSSWPPGGRWGLCPGRGSEGPQRRSWPGLATGAGGNGSLSASPSPPFSFTSPPPCSPSVPLLRLLCSL